MGFNSERALSGYLQSGEKLIWVGAPHVGLLFRKPDIFLVQFNMLWGGFAIFWEIMALRSGAPFFFPLFGIPFVLLGLYMMAGRFIYDSIKRSKIVYGITNERVLILSGIYSQSLRSINLKTVNEVSLQMKPSGKGTIIFGSNNWSPMFFWNPFWFHGDQMFCPCFEWIDNPNQVYQLIQSMQRGYVNR
jgi:hypothetical protein